MDMKLSDCTEKQESEKMYKKVYWIMNSAKELIFFFSSLMVGEEVSIDNLSLSAQINHIIPFLDFNRK